MNKRECKNFIALGARIGIFILALSFSLLAQGKNPLILIPGLTGSELRDKKTNEKVWMTAFKSKSDDLRLPILADPTKSSDNLVATDVIRSLKIGALPVYDVYGGFIKAMGLRGGYHEE